MRSREALRFMGLLLLLLSIVGCMHSESGETGQGIGDRGIVFETVATLGEEGLQPGELVFGKISDLEVDAENRILIADSEMQSLRRLTIEGETLWSLATQGQGPGEVHIPWLVTVLDDQVFLFDIGKHRVMVAGLEDAEPRHEIIVPYFLHGMTVDHEGGVFAAGVLDGDLSVVEQHVIHRFDREGNVLASYPVERPFHTERGPSFVAKQIIHQYYAGRVAVESNGEHLLISPVFDRSSYRISRDGETLVRFENTYFDTPLLNYEASESGVTFKNAESQSGPALSMPDGRILKGYQVARDGTLQYTVDLFAADGVLLASQISVPGMPLAIGGDDRVYAVSNLPYPQIFVLEMTEPQDHVLVDTATESGEGDEHS
ncbi:MAG: hypothetical protein AAGD38_13565 [Acidobacteriota bacterium]